MLSQVFLGLACLLPTVLLHCLYSLLLLKRFHKLGPDRSDYFHWRNEKTLLLLEVTFVLFLLHFTEAAIWAALYSLHPEGLSDFATSLYFSISTYTTIGYGDVILSPALRLTGAIEGIVGTFMFGWSVAILVAVLKPNR